MKKIACFVLVAMAVLVPVRPLPAGEGNAGDLHIESAVPLQISR